MYIYIYTYKYLNMCVRIDARACPATCRSYINVCMNTHMRKVHGTAYMRLKWLVRTAARTWICSYTHAIAYIW